MIGTPGGLHVSHGEDRAVLLAGEPITAIDADGDDLWVLAGRRDLHRVAAGTAEQVASLEGDDRGICLGIHSGTVWVGGDRARLWRLVGSRLDEVTAFADAPTSDEWHTPWGGPPDVFSMASYGDDLYVSVHVGGIIRTSDGERWESTIDLHDDVHQVVVGPDGTVWAATGRRGLAESRDRGSTWRYHRDGLHATYLLAVAATGDGVVVGASSGHAGRDGAVYRFDGQRFTRAVGLPVDFAGAVGTASARRGRRPGGGRAAERRRLHQRRWRRRVDPRGHRLVGDLRDHLLARQRVASRPTRHGERCPRWRPAELRLDRRRTHRHRAGDVPAHRWRRVIAVARSAGGCRAARRASPTVPASLTAGPPASGG